LFNNVSHFLTQLTHKNQIRKSLHIIDPVFCGCDTEILPEMFQLAADGKLKMDIVNESLPNIETVRSRDVEAGKRIVTSI